MAKIMKWATVIAAFLTVVFCLLYHFFPNSFLLTSAITAGTFLYHLSMRLTVGTIVDKRMRNKANLSRRWYQPLPFEKQLYRRLGVKRWKHLTPTYAPDTFDIGKHSFSEVAQAMCQAEIVHEIIFVLSFVPLLFAIVWDSFWVFMITSLLAALYDLHFVILQRYNRPRIIKLVMISG